MPSLAGLFFWMNRKTEDINKIIVKNPLKLDFGKTINNDPTKFFTEDIMKQLDECATKEFKYGNKAEEVVDGNSEQT